MARKKPAAAPKSPAAKARKQAAASAAAAELRRPRAAAVLTGDLVSQIRSGELAPGARVLSGPALARRYRLSYQTVVRALDELVQRGLLVRQHGRGTFVAPRPTPPPEGKAARTVLLALDPRALERGRFGYAVVEALDEALVHAGLRLRYAPLSGPGEAALLEELAAGQGEADLLLAFDRAVFLARALKRCPGLPALALHAAPKPEAGAKGFDAVLVEDADGGRQAGSYLLAQGHQRIAYLGGPADDARARDRGAGLREALAGQKVTPAAERSSDGWDEGAGLAAGDLLLGDLGEAKPLAVFCANDRLAAGFYRAAKARGLEIPRDVSVIGFDDHEIAATLSPPLTTLRLDRAEYGRAAARAVTERLAAPSKPPHTQRLPVLLIERASVRTV
ncbi:MAG: substrate-binding domain-containing protein [Planctomycetes bacterium]|nr:substrate-binding domain-containing protein [Planctomycetota bacterium]